MKCGLLGRKLGHSYSPEIHAHFGNYSYELIEKEPQELEFFLQNGDFTGLNVTMPYKIAVIPHLDELTPIAQNLGAVNTIVRRNGKLIGTNTDYFGFQTLLRHSGLSPADKKCLIFGSGGASKVVEAVLKEENAEVIIISRNGENNYDNLSLHQDAAIIINATPVGMYPNTGLSPVDLDIFPHLKGVLDVIYNPARTKLLMDADCRGLVTANGLGMLVAQAKEAAEWFSQAHIPNESILEVHRILKSKMENIILIGMPGCGKSTIGQVLAEKTGKILVDLDKEIEKKANKFIPDIFVQDGEAVFRKWESAVIKEFGKQSSLIIATGGGCVTRPENYPLLHQNGKIFWLKRDLDQLPIQGRPLSQIMSLDQMYALREPMYRRFADHIIDNSGRPEETAMAILEVFG